jgi:hypothetical protein
VEASFLDGSEEVTRLQLVRPRARRGPVRRDEVFEQPRDVAPISIPRVPDQADAAVRPEDAVQLRYRLVVAEPVECLADRDCVDGAVAERDRFGGADQRLDARQHPPQLAEHLLAGLDRDDVRAARQQRTGELSGSRTEVEHRPPRPQVELVDEPRDSVGRILRPGPLVHVGHELEGAGVWMLQLSQGVDRSTPQRSRASFARAAV